MRLSSRKILYAPEIEDLVTRVGPISDYANVTAALEMRFGVEFYSEVLHRLFRLDLSASAAKSILLSILAHHAELSLKLGRDLWLITSAADYLQTTNRLLSAPVLIDAQSLKLHEDNAFKDDLTGLFNRRYLNQELPREINKFRRFGFLFSILMLDLDHFKQFNDTHGHLAGDMALKCIAQALLFEARLYDRAIRYGGDEFVIILPQASQKQAALIAQRIRSSICGLKIRFENTELDIPTVSIGIASYPLNALDMQTLLKKADQALYMAKVKRNKIATYKDAKRRHPRFNLSHPIRVQIRNHENDVFLAKANDISMGGIQCETKVEFTPNTTIDILLTSPNLRMHLPLKAQIRRLECLGDGEYLLGLSFRLNSTQQKISLYSLITHDASEGVGNVSETTRTQADFQDFKIPA